ncbi:hypothetical protein EDD11_009526 [Mortierella claussenii]|nr:hypothetical protein EDD11_009526 [Mortierella claussenii]
MADLSITAPNATSFVVAGGSLNVAWDYTGSMPPTPATISVELVDNPHGSAHQSENNHTIHMAHRAKSYSLGLWRSSQTWRQPQVAPAGPSQN